MLRGNVDVSVSVTENPVFFALEQVGHASVLAADIK